MATGIEVLGLKELRRALMKTIPERMQGKVLQSALVAGARPIVSAAKSMAPSDSGRLKRAIHSRRDRKYSDGSYEQRQVTVRHGKKYQKRGQDAYYWKWIEFGRGEVVVKHRKGRRGAKRTVLSDGSTVFGARVKAVPARPFMRPAFEMNKNRSAVAIRDGLEKAIKRAVERARWRTPRRR